MQRVIGDAQPQRVAVKSGRDRCGSVTEEGDIGSVNGAGDEDGAIAGVGGFADGRAQFAIEVEDRRGIRFQAEIIRAAHAAGHLPDLQEFANADGDQS